MENAVERLLRREEVEHIVGLRHSAIYRRSEQASFLDLFGSDDEPYDGGSLILTGGLLGYHLGTPTNRSTLRGERFSSRQV